jgi:uncharacterized protein YdiU (UPF0061 family)
MNTTLLFDNRFITELPGDQEEGPRVRQVRGALWSRVLPTPVAAPRLLAWSPECASLLGLNAEDAGAAWFADVFGGNRLIPGMQPYAANYGGHQFGNWAGQLGDGRAILLGETVNAGGERWELQLKGAGLTPYSRGADGRAVLRSSIREFLCSEAMHHLGVPTTRALSLVATGEGVMRDMFYDGRPREEPGAIVCRVAPSFIRFGNFELPAARGEVELLQKLVDFTIARDFPQFSSLPETGRRIAWFRDVCERTAIMVAHWMRVGFVHGVMNTDNLSILGLTIDYGPYGWIDNFDPDWTPNTTDAGGRRYRFGHQARIAHWNLAQLANALVPVMQDTTALEECLEHYVQCFLAAERANNAAKLGLRHALAVQDSLMRELFGLLHAAEADMTIFFRRLAGLDVNAPSLDPLESAFYDPSKRATSGRELLDWLERYAARVREEALDPAERTRRMQAANPCYVPRNYLAQQAIDSAEAGDTAPLHELMDVLRNPYSEQPGRESFAGRRPDWARNRAGCSMLSCSS